MKKIFSLLFLISTCLLHSSEDTDLTALPTDDTPILAESDMALIDNEGSSCANDDQDKDLFSKEKEEQYVVVSRSSCSPLILFGRAKSEPIEHQKEERNLRANFLAPGQRNTQFSDPSSKVPRSQTPAAVTEKTMHNPSPTVLRNETSSLFKTATYCPSCKTWHTQPNLSQALLPQILFIKKPQTTLWSPLYRKDRGFERSLVQKATASLASLPVLEQKFFYFIPDAYNQEVLHHMNLQTKKLEESSLDDPLHQIPHLCYTSRLLLQARSLLPEAIIYSCLLYLEGLQQKQKNEPLILDNETSPLVPTTIPNSYSSFSSRI